MIRLKNYLPRSICWNSSLREQLILLRFLAAKVNWRIQRHKIKKKMRMITIYQLLVHKCLQKRKPIPLSHLTSARETILNMRKNSNIANTRMNTRIVQPSKDNSRISQNLWITRRWSSTRMQSRSNMSRESNTSGISKCSREWVKGLISSSSRRALKVPREFMEDQGREVAQESKWDLLSPW